MTQVHPHAGGECDLLADEFALDDGSPPRGWGMLKRPVTRNKRDEVHPHAGGECTPAQTRPTRRVGSPPRGWGMRYNATQDRATARFTPTRVGNAGIPASPSPSDTVHPHAGGECSSCRSRPSAAPGSPPRGWGMPAGMRATLRAHRFTPTRVGNARSIPPISSRAAVHPHAGGECDVLEVEENFFVRFTPTRVGNAIKP